jgi:hypothetical protein
VRSLHISSFCWGSIRRYLSNKIGFMSIGVRTQKLSQFLYKMLSCSPGQGPGRTGPCAGRFRSAARSTGCTAGRPGANRLLRRCHPGGLLRNISQFRSRSGPCPGLDRLVRSLARSTGLWTGCPGRWPGLTGPWTGRPGPRPG